MQEHVRTMQDHAPPHLPHCTHLPTFSATSTKGLNWGWEAAAMWAALHTPTQLPLSRPSAICGGVHNQPAPHSVGYR